MYTKHSDFIRTFMHVNKHITDEEINVVKNWETVTNKTVLSYLLTIS